MCDKYEKREIRKRAKAFTHHCSLLSVLVILQLKNEDHPLYTPWLTCQLQVFSQQTRGFTGPPLASQTKADQTDADYYEL